MKTVFYIVRKEFKQIFRNRGMLPIIFVMPMIQLLVLSNAATYEIKNITLGVVDHDRTSTSRALVNHFAASSYFKLQPHFEATNAAQTAMQEGNVSVVLEIPRNFERAIGKEQQAALGVTIDAIDGAAAGVEQVYITQIIQRFDRDLQRNTPWKLSTLKPVETIETIPLFWYNETLNYKTFMVPGILVLLVTMIGLFLSGMNIVREKELGTLEQINVTPIKKSQFIVGKLFPFWILGLVVLSIGLIIARWVFQVPILGSLLTLYLFTTIYLLVVLGIGLLISNFTETQQQAMFIAWFFAVVFILMSGLFTAIESMPQWAQYLTYLNPVKYFVEVMRMVLLKGASMVDILPQLGKTFAYAVVVNGLATWSYRKTQ